MSNELIRNPGQFDEVIHIIDSARSRAMKVVNAELILFCAEHLAHEAVL